MDFRSQQAELTAWRRDIHAHPELGFEEYRTADFVAARLAEFGVDQVCRGVGGTGVVATIRAGTGSRSIGLRADMDALPIHEQNEVPHRSLCAGVMHACGHDGHTVMLLGAAKRLAATRRFDGAVHLVFQPAEETQRVVSPGAGPTGGAHAMMADGLFERFPMEAIFGMHNRPGLAAGYLGVRPGVIYAATDRFEVTIIGVGGHAARPHLGVDPVVVTAQVILAVQTIASRFTSPTDSVVVSICQVQGGAAFNVIPGSVSLVGTVRTLSEDTRQTVKRLFEQLVSGVTASFGAAANIDYQLGHPALVNDAALTARVRAIMVSRIGEGRVEDLEQPTMAGEDFACYLAEKPGCFVLIGNGDTGQGAIGVHNANYDFNDDVAPLGVEYWTALVEEFLPVDGTRGVSASG